MKKNININLFGTIYNIDEDAYELLQEYLTNLRSYFGKQEGGEEIADDIEHRIAELFWEKKQQGVDAIDVMTVKTILNKLGKPEQMTDEGEEPASETGKTPEQPSENESKKESATAAEPGPRKLYRDTNDKLLGGVLSGLCHYFGGTDPLPWRILFVVVVLLLMAGNYHIFGFSISSFILMLVYLVLWMVIPEAQNSEDRLRMQGKKVTPETIKEEVIREQEKREKPKQNESGVRNTANGCLSFFVTMFKIFITLILLAIMIPLVVMLICIVVGVLVMGSTAAAWSPFVETGDVSGWWLFAFVASGLTVLILPVYGLCRLIFSKKPRNTSTTLILMAIWVCALAGLFPLAKRAGMQLKDNVHFTWNFGTNRGRLQTGDTDIISRNDVLEPFKSVEFDGVGELILSQADSCSFNASGMTEIIDNTTVTVRDSVLYIRTHKTDGYSIDEIGTIEFNVQLPVLEQFRLNGVGKVRLQDTFEQQEPMTLTINGVGGMHADKIVCPNVTVKNNGVGKTELYVESQDLNVSNNGIGLIELSGKTYHYNVSKTLVAHVDDSGLMIGDK